MKLSRRKKDALGLINWREFRLDYEWRPAMISDEIHHFAGAYSTLLRSAPTEELHAFASRVARLERVVTVAGVAAKRLEMIQLNGPFGAVPRWTLDLIEALKELETIGG